ncbi:MAG: 2'-5' RNA ligase family protein [Phycisphaerae bacterium]
MKTHCTALVLIPPLEVWEPIQTIRRRYDRQFKRWMPHVTLLYPFRPMDGFEAIRPALEQRCARIPPFEVALTTLSYFEHTRDKFTMWLAPEPAEPVVALQSALLECAPDCNDVNLHAGGFRPHLSLGQARSAAELEERMRCIRSTWRPMCFVVRDIALIRRGPDRTDAFEVDRWIPFRATT